MIIDRDFIEDAFSKDYDYFVQQMNKLIYVIQFEAIKQRILDANKNEQFKVGNPIKPIKRKCINCYYSVILGNDDGVYCIRDNSFQNENGHCDHYLTK